ncbi:uncharacterized protein [Spinacia oleracea]|uniref:Uncharacterized protein isoform X3 n=1 Tax=Spinacia oleracea TaxID=3562 RepID=A0ABM3RKF6_SPIOL|nr:uncharacterized protein LOC110786305 isoform X3 [Spinacia oleracea]
MRFFCVDPIHSRDPEQSADSIMNSNLIRQMLQRPSTGSRFRMHLEIMVVEEKNQVVMHSSFNYEADILELCIEWPLF